VKRRKKNRTRQSGKPALPSIAGVRRFSRTSLLALLEAASCSPTAAHRLQSLGVLFASVADASDDQPDAVAADLGALLDEVTSRVPLHHLEDYVPADPRLVVVVRWRNELFRILPGSLERPVAMIERARIVAEAIDGTLVNALGFSLSDICELILRRIDSVAAVLAPAWGTDRADAPGAPASVAEAELAAARTAPPLTEIVTSCSNPERAAGALRWATSRTLRYDPSAAGATFGRTLVIEQEGRESIAIPSGFWIDSLDTIINELATLAVETDPQVDLAFQRRTATELARLLRRLKLPVSHRVPVGSLGEIHSVIRFGTGTQVAIDLSAGLRNRANQADRSLERLETYQPDGIDVVRIHVVAGSGHMIVMSSADRIVSTTLDDLSWIVNRSLKDPDDVLFFFRELLEHPNIGSVMALETINAFEHWRDNDKVFLSQGAGYDFVLMEFHRGDAEWIQAARLAPLERALLSLGLSNAAAWDLFDFEEDIGRAMLGHLPNGPAWYVRLIPDMSVGIHCFDGKTAAGFRGLLLNLAEGVLWRLEHSASAQAVIARVLGAGHPVKFWFEPVPTDELQPVIRSLGAQGNRIVLGWDSRLPDYCEKHSSEVESVIGNAIRDALFANETDGAEFIDAWTAAPSGFRMDAERLPVGQVELPDPEPFSIAARSEAGRELAIRIKNSGVSPGNYEGRPASELESQTLAPTLFKILAESISPFDASQVLDAALTQLEYAVCDGYLKGRRRAWNERFPVLGYDPIARTVEEREENVRLAKAIRLIIEEIVNNPPQGDRSPDRVAWRRLLGVADLCSEAGLRSEQNHYGLTPVATIISQQYEITQKMVGEALIDFPEFKRAQARRKRQVGKKLAESDLKDVAAAMEREMGFRPETVGMVLATISAWKTDVANPSPSSTIDELVSKCVNDHHDLSPGAAQTAVNALILNQKGLASSPIEHWEQERRSVRLMTRPIVQLADGSIRLLPWQSDASWRVFLGYLSEGRCMWPVATLPPSVQAALIAFREKRNRELEVETERQFLLLTPLVRRNVKKAKVLGLDPAKFHGEIDAIAVDEQRGIIWVADAKDVFVTFSPATLRGSYQKFHEDPNYVDKVRKKAESVRTDPVAVARALGAKVPDRTWDVRPLMVTRNVEPAAFATAGSIEFCTISELVAFASATVGSN